MSAAEHIFTTISVTDAQRLLHSLSPADAKFILSSISLTASFRLLNQIIDSIQRCRNSASTSGGAAPPPLFPSMSNAQQIFNSISPNNAQRLLHSISPADAKYILSSISLSASFRLLNLMFPDPLSHPPAQRLRASASASHLSLSHLPPVERLLERLRASASTSQRRGDISLSHLPPAERLRASASTSQRRGDTSLSHLPPAERLRASASTSQRRGDLSSQKAMTPKLAFLKSNQVEEIKLAVKCLRCKSPSALTCKLEEDLKKVSQLVMAVTSDEQLNALIQRFSPSPATCGQCKEASLLVAINPPTKRDINWLGLLLAEQLGTLSCEQMVYFCRHNNIEWKGSNNRKLFYMVVTTMLFHLGVMRTV